MRTSERGRRRVWGVTVKRQMVHAMIQSDFEARHAREEKTAGLTLPCDCGHFHFRRVFLSVLHSSIWQLRGRQGILPTITGGPACGFLRTWPRRRQSGRLAKVGSILGRCSAALHRNYILLSACAVPYRERLMMRAIFPIRIWKIDRSFTWRRPILSPIARTAVSPRHTETRTINVLEIKLLKAGALLYGRGAAPTNLQKEKTLSPARPPRH